MDIASLIGVFFGVGMILLGQKIEGGNASSLLQLTAAIIVLGGTMGAILLQFPMKTIMAALGGLKTAFLGEKTDAVRHHYPDCRFPRAAPVVKEFWRWKKRSQTCRIHFSARRSAWLLMDWSLRRSMRQWKPKWEPLKRNGSIKARVWEAAGGYLPTVGIIGAVVGLIHVMQGLSKGH